MTAEEQSRYDELVAENEQLKSEKAALVEQLRLDGKDDDVVVEQWLKERAETQKQVAAQLKKMKESLV